MEIVTNFEASTSFSSISPVRGSLVIILFFLPHATVTAVELDTQHREKVVRVVVEDWVET